MANKYFYHWTHRRNLRSIIETGLDPNRATSNFPRVWICTQDKIAWAMGHVAQNHKWDADELVLIRIRSENIDEVRTAFPGVYVVKLPIQPCEFHGVKHSLILPFLIPGTDKSASDKQ